MYELLKEFFLVMDRSKEDEERLLPAYFNSLKRLDLELMSEVLIEMTDNWKNRFPTVPQIKDQYNLKKYRHQLKASRNQEQGATNAASKFWQAYKECKEQNITDFDVITKHLAASVSNPKEKKKTSCPNNFCDGNEWIVAVRENDPMKSEVLFSCKCRIREKVECWSNQPGYKIVKGLNPEIKL